jgi:hypothetical protein|tara:strand:+ start:56 stop:382 length:327 start_codon:yes stop_codon:yes gene_type:complete
MSEETKKKIVFYDTDKRHANLKIRLHYDGLTQAGFFRAMVSGYLDKDAAILDFVKRLQEQENVHSVNKRTKSNKLLESGEGTQKSFSLLKEKEIENIFDIIEKEFPEL